MAARALPLGQRHWHINRQELFSLCDAALFVDELVTDALAVGKTCTVSFQVDSNAAARWVQNNKVLCKTLERHAINRLVGIYSDLSQEWRRHKVTVSVEEIKGESNEVSDKLSRLVYEHGLVEALYGTDTQIDNFPDAILAVGDGIGQAPSDDLKFTLKAPAEAEYEDLTNLYDNLLLFGAFRSWKATRHDVGTKELTTQNGERAHRWLRDWQRESLNQRPSSMSRYSGVKAYGGPYYSMTADGILVELRYPYGDILAIPNECYLLPTDDMSIIDSIILFYHEKGGHTNSRHTRWRIGRAFRWPHMRRDIERVCRRCVRCQFVAAYRRSRSIKRHLDTSARLPWQVISIDLLGHLSRFVVLSALKDASTRSVVDALHDIWCLWGRPVVLRADNGPAFRGQFKRQMRSEGMQLQQKLVVSAVLEDRERRDSPQDPNRVPSQPPVGSTVIRVPPSDRSGRLRQDKTIYEVVRLGGDGVTTYVRPVRSALDANNNDDDDSDVVREHCSNFKRFWGASCENPNS
ncbi:hypothetical protein FOZ60_009149 [Perkinsus olseni]|uniref:Integrase zinc-binding domain-containing protein n=1 Tax=Perkinsus olseni TaxID=32597 RepID=A0A7J6NHZ8_PEROL|nr:hypothetical protein FOZ60_009149 [Perkinsus olseni]